MPDTHHTALIDGDGDGDIWYPTDDGRWRLPREDLVRTIEQIEYRYGRAREVVLVPAAEYARLTAPLPDTMREIVAGLRDTAGRLHGDLRDMLDSAADLIERLERERATLWDRLDHQAWLDVTQAAAVADDASVRDIVAAIKGLAAERDDARTDLKRLAGRAEAAGAAVDAAKAWRAAIGKRGMDGVGACQALVAAVDALGSTQDGTGNGPKSHADAPTDPAEGEGTSEAAEAVSAGYAIRRIGAIHDTGADRTDLHAQILHAGQVVARLHIDGRDLDAYEAYAAIRDALDHTRRCGDDGQVPYDAAAVRTDAERHADPGRTR